MTTLFAAGMILAVLILLGCVLADVFWPLSIVMVIGLISAVSVLGWSVLWVLWHPIYIGLYVVVAFCWLFFRWTQYVDAKYRKAVEYKKAHPNYCIAIPNWSNEWDDFIHCWFFWPMDMMAYVLKDLLADLWKFIGRMVSESFNKYAKWRFKDL
jgi:hypothetical protein